MIWGYKSSTGTEIWNFPGLPPESIILVHNLEYFTLLKRQTCIGTWYGRILQGRVICHCSHIELVKKIYMSKWKPCLEQIQHELYNHRARCWCYLSQFMMKSSFKNKIKPQTLSVRYGRKKKIISYIVKRIDLQLVDHSENVFITQLYFSLLSLLLQQQHTDVSWEVAIRASNALRIAIKF